MKSKTIGLPALLLVSGIGSALAAAGPEAACQALSEQTREAVALKKQGLAVDKAVAQLSAQPEPDSVPSAQHELYKTQLPSATRFAT